MKEINVLFYLGMLFFAAFLTKKFTQKFKIPEVTGYVIVGVLLGESILKILTNDVVDKLGYLSTIALGIIAFTIGAELKLSTIKKLGKSITAIVFFESFGAFIIVFFTLAFVFKGEMYKALLLGSVAAATAPAATVAVIRQYKAKGSLTSTIIAVVGIDDAVALIIYVFASSFAKGMILGEHISSVTILINALISIGLSAVIGIVAAYVYIFIMKNIRNEDTIELMITAFILMLLGVTEQFHISELLTIMIFSAFITNLSPIIEKRSGKIVDFFVPIFLAAFFILGGAHLDIRVVKQIGGIGMLYFFARSIGKIGGASLGAVIGGATDKVKKYIGFALLPQVGVALALALSIKKNFSIPLYGDKGKDIALVVINILLFTTMITEVIGPFLTKLVLKKSGEIKE
ncbi:cation:proton antiporter [Haliovirga abyssi]|uniref:Potassium transporter n=1 Tax=Haliovirga abyssi TaxID=2996794 RepID=A0AAU9DGR0_9FUSO|nr:cation:proton antiporter [Haliovirga abyssi]BDU51458.1 potassium transporter [Haliovirga abyssi]